VGVKALVLARGLATRMRRAEADAGLSPAQQRAAAAGLKAMMPVGDDRGARPFLDHVLGTLAAAGLSAVGLVIGPEHEEIRARYEGDARPRRLTLAWPIQAEPRGTADAVLAAESWAGADPFLVLNADNLYPIDVLQSLCALNGPGLPAFERDELVRSSNIPEERIASFALLRVDADGFLSSIIEKPGADVMRGAGPRALVSMNCWRFDARIFEACRAVPRSPRGEFELPMAVGVALARGVPFTVVPARGEVLDLSRQSDVTDVSRRLRGRAVSY
jgi:glucose-1-phosphate thymidylyltransferase